MKKIWKSLVPYIAFIMMILIFNVPYPVHTELSGVLIQTENPDFCEKVTIELDGSYHLNWLTHDEYSGYFRISNDNLTQIKKLKFPIAIGVDFEDGESELEYSLREENLSEEEMTKVLDDLKVYIGGRVLSKRFLRRICVVVPSVKKDDDGRICWNYGDPYNGKSNFIVAGANSYDEAVQILTGSYGHFVQFINEKNYKWDVTRLDMQNEEPSNEEQARRMKVFGQMFRSIFFDDSKEAERVIGTIDGKDITARDFELRALKIREGGAEYPYKTAWETMKQEAAELQYIKKQNCYDDFLDLANQVFRETRTAYSEDKQFREYCDEQKKLLGLTDEKYWAFMEEANQRIQFHLLVQDYIKQNDYPAIDVKTIEDSLQDEEYKDKVFNKK